MEVKLNKINVYKCATGAGIINAVCKANKGVTCRKLTAIMGKTSSATVHLIKSGGLYLNYDMLNGIFKASAKYTKAEKSYLRIVLSIAERAPLVIRKSILSNYKPVNKVGV